MQKAALQTGLTKDKLLQVLSTLQGWTDGHFARCILPYHPDDLVSLLHDASFLHAEHEKVFALMMGRPDEKLFGFAWELSLAVNPLRSVDEIIVDMDVEMDKRERFWDARGAHGAVDDHSH